MKTHTFSIVVGTGACNFKCPFCVSKMTCRAAKVPTVNWTRFEIACRTVLMARDGLINAMLTGTGEPDLYPECIDDYLEAMDGRFPLITLQTNGSKLDEDKLKRWAEAGLTSVCISIAHFDPIMSNEILQAEERIRRTYNFWDAVDMIKYAGLMVRLNCTMLNEGINDHAQVEQLITHCKDYGVEQLTLREVDKPDNAADSEIKQYVDAQKPNGAAKRLWHYLEMQGAHRLPDLPHGGILLDYRGLCLAFGNCLTETSDRNNIRQIIFFPTGEISYDWKYKGARIL